MFKNEKEENQSESPEFLKPRKKSYWWVWLIVILVLIGGGIAYGYYTKPLENPYITEIATRQDITQSVEVTGTIKPSAEINLNFKSAGTITSINVEISDQIYKGDVLASLDTSELNSQLAQSQASVSVAQAQLSQVLEGSRPEEISVAETNIDTAQSNLSTAQINYQLTKNQIANDLKTAETNLSNTQKLLADALTNLNNIQNQTDQNLINTIDSNLNQLNIILISEQSVKTNIENVYDNNTWYEIFKDLDFGRMVQTDNLRKQTPFVRQNAQTSYNQALITRTVSDNQQAISDMLLYLDNITQILNNTNSMLYMESAQYIFTSTDLSSLKSRQSANEASHNSNLTNTQNLKNSIDNTNINNQISVDNAQNQVTSYQNQIQTAEENIESIKITSNKKLQDAQDQITNAEDQLKIQQKQLDLIKAGPTSAAIAVAQAQVAQTQAAVKVIQTQIANQQIIAPSNGIITQVNVSEGEQSSSANPIIQMHSDAKYEINAEIAETDINKIKIGDKTIIDFDAFTKDDKFTGEVVEIDPASTVLQGVVYYNTKVILDTEDPKIKPGMTANIEIITAEAKDVIAVPNQAVKKDGSQYFVEILTDETTLSVEKSTVTTGLRANTHTEIKSGLSGEENIIILKNE
ncbi:efflux RND transporter periplasmic adaptor subunit [Patescibacteria group bacterium]|nr:efflux RND transporter periplasmic adaptor subunit [Patescibacteria group bacterium]